MLTPLESQNLQSIIRMMFEQGVRHFDIWELPIFPDNTFFEYYDTNRLTHFDDEFEVILKKIAPEYHCQYIHTLQRYPGIYVFKDIK